MKIQWLAVFLTLLLIFVAYYWFERRTGSSVSRQPVARAARTFQVDSANFGSLHDTPVHIYTLCNPAGMCVKISDFGGTITSILVPDKEGKIGDVVLGFDSLDGYLQKNNPYFGALVGRYANRIGGAKFSLNGKTYPLGANDHGNSLHGGFRGFDKVVWRARPFQTDSTAGLELRYLSRDGEEGYPGNLSCLVVYTLTGDNTLRISYEASTDKATPVNLTNHTYFNLGGPENGDVLGEILQIHADQFTPVNDLLIPTGQQASVKGTPMNFSQPKVIGLDLPKVKGAGYDHNYLIKGEDGQLRPAAKVFDPKSGRTMEMLTTEPGVQFYTGNFLDGTLRGKGGVSYGRHTALCLEAQHYPDSPNQPSFPNTILYPGHLYHQITAYKFE